MNNLWLLLNARHWLMGGSGAHHIGHLTGLLCFPTSTCCVCLIICDLLNVLGHSLHPCLNTRTSYYLSTISTFLICWFIFFFNPHCLNAYLHIASIMYCSKDMNSVAGNSELCLTLVWCLHTWVSLFPKFLHTATELFLEIELRNKCWAATREITPASICACISMYAQKSQISMARMYMLTFVIGNHQFIIEHLSFFRHW